MIEAAQRRFGFALLIDCHSMPSSSPDVGGCDIVLGDRYGSSAARWIVDAVEAALRASGLNVRRNKPYAGGYITEHYGAPPAGRHALQIEINRSLYMDERTLRLTEGAAPLIEALSAMTAALCGHTREAVGDALGGGMSARVAGDDAAEKRRPPEGGLSQGRKRPKEGICDVSHRNNIALQRSKSKRIVRDRVARAHQAELSRVRRSVGAEPCATGNASTPKKRRPPLGGLSLGRKRPRRAYAASAARGVIWRQTPQMQDHKRSLTHHRCGLRRFCNSTKAGFSAYLENNSVLSASYRCAQKAALSRYNYETCLLCN